MRVPLAASVAISLQAAERNLVGADGFEPSTPAGMKHGSYESDSTPTRQFHDGRL